MSMLCDIVTTIIDFFSTVTTAIGTDLLFIIALAVEAVLVIFFLVKSAFSYEASLNRSLDKLNYWLFERKTITEENIREFNTMMKTKAPKRLCYFWQQYILFREGSPSSYMSTDNLVEKPLKTSSYNSNIKNLNVFSIAWSVIVFMFILIAQGSSNILSADILSYGVLVIAIIYLINLIFTIYLRARKNALLNSIYQNVSLFGRFMDNACIDLPSYIDYQILFTPAEIEKGQPVLREFLDYKARKEKEDFNRAKEQDVEYETYDFSSTGVNGSVVLDRAMKESEIYLKKKEKSYVRISQLESQLDTLKKNFDNVQKDYQTKLQTSKENVDRLLQQQEETTNRIESNYLRKQQTQELAKQEQLDQEFEQQRARYLLEKNEYEEEIKKNQADLEESKREVEKAMLGEYQNFFNNFCHSAEKVVTKVFADKMNKLKQENQESQERITQLEIQLKNSHQGAYDAASQGSDLGEGKYDDKGNFVYGNGSFYSPDGLFHDVDGKVYNPDGSLVEDKPAQTEDTSATTSQEPQTIDLNSLDAFDFMTDISEKDDIYNVAENVVNNVDSDIKVINSEEKSPAIDALDTFTLDTSEEEGQPAETTINTQPETSETSQEIIQPVEEKPRKKAGRPRKVVDPSQVKPKGKPGRPRKVVAAQEPEQPKKRPGRPRKDATVKVETQQPKKRAGRPKKIVNAPVENKPKGKRGRPRKNASLEELNKRISEQEDRLNEMRDNLNREFETAIKNLDDTKTVDNETRKNEIFQEIEKLQQEAKNISASDSERKISEINSKLETLIAEVKKLNS